MKPDRLRITVHRIALAAAVVIPVMLAGACATSPEPGGEAAPPEPEPKAPPAASAVAESAIADLSPTEGNDVSGTVRFESTDEGVRLTVQLRNLTPGPHGFHVHQTGDCSAPDGTSAGGHYAPGGTPHGAPDNPPDKRHVGDLGNIVADDAGQVDTEFVDPVLSLSGEHSILGKAVIVHAGEDDLQSQPTGGAGKRVACGVIKSLQG
jgi:Cu-Zn family superoxide dismutase